MRNIKSIFKRSTTPKVSHNLESYEPSLDSSAKETVSNLNDWGAQQAQMHHGTKEGLVSSLTRVERGHIVEAGTEKDKQHEAKKQYIDQINQNEKDIISNHSRIKDIDDNKIPFEEKKILKNKDEISSLELDKTKSVLASNYSAVNNYFLLFLVVIIAIYLLMFYASAINAALFTNMADKLQNVSSDNLNALFVSIFDVDVFTVWTAKSIFIYIGSVLFIGIGYLPHTTDSNFKKAIFYLFPLVVDGMLAYKIESNIYESKVMTGLANPNMPWVEHFYSINFWLVIAFGYVAYFVWGQLWNAWTIERLKKDAGKMSYLQIQNIKEKTSQSEELIEKYKVSKNDLKSEIEKFNKDIEQIKINMNYVVYSRQDLSRKLNTFFDGWLKYITTDSQLKGLVGESKITFKEFSTNLKLV